MAYNPNIEDLMRQYGGGGASRINAAMLQSGGSAGFFDPHGSPLVMQEVRRGALRSADARRRRRGTLAAMLGLDPQQSRIAMLDAEKENSGDISNTIGNANLHELLGTQDFFRNNYSGQLRDALAADYARQNRPGIGDIFGEILGTAAGGFGSSYASGLGNRLGGGKRQPYQDPYG